MARLDLTIHLDDPSATYHPGDPVGGSLRCVAHKDSTVKDLSVELLWRTHGKGNRDEGGRTGLSVFAGELRAGDERSWRFTLTAPDGPPSYAGRIVNLGWLVRAQADVPWAFDPKCEVDVVVHGSGGGGNASGDSGGLKTARQAMAQAMAGVGAADRPKRSAIGCAIFAVIVAVLGVFVVIPLLGALLSLVVVGAAGLSRGDWGEALVLLVPLLVGAAVAAIAFKLLRPLLASRKIGPVTVTLPGGDHARGGQSLAVEVQTVPRSAGRLKGATVELIGEEVAVSGSGTNRTTHRHRLHTEQMELAAARDFHPGLPMQLRGQVQLPGGAAPSLSTGNNRVHWRLEVHLDIERWPDWTGSQELVVAPAGATAAV